MLAVLKHLSTANIVTFAGLFSLLNIASLAIYSLKQKVSQATYHELVERMRSWWVIVLLLSVALCISERAIIYFFAYVSFIALKEYFTMIPTRRADRRVIFWAYLSIILQYTWVALHWYGMFMIFIPLYLFLFIPMRMASLGHTDGFIKSSSTIHWGVMLTVYCVSHIAYLTALPDEVDRVNHGISLVLFVIVITQINDIAQYCWGKMIGGAKIIPKVSPNKTISGFVGGVITTACVASMLATKLTPMSHLEGALLGAMMAVFGFMGDITMSAVKRDLHIKDTGNFLPGHGGILDRVDSLIFTAPLFFHILRYWYY